jgi:hypothetical protein
MPQALFGIVNPRETPPLKNGPPNGPFGFLVSATLHGGTGTKCNPGSKVRVAFVDTPLKDAVTLTTVCAGTLEVIAEKVAEDKPAGTVTVAGTWTAELSLSSATLAFACAGELSVTVPVTEVGALIVEELKLIELTTIGAGFTVRVTGTVTGELAAPKAVITMFAL